jgi:branched-chain amino acid aminotransferase
MVREHMDRMFDTSMKIMRMTIPYSKEDLINVSIELIKKNEFKEDIHMRPTVYFGRGKNFGFKPEEIFTGAFVRAAPRPPRPTLEKGVRCCVTSWTRISDKNVPPRVKAGANYQNNRLALYDAFMNGYDNVILLTDEGKVSEGHGSNIFVVRKGIPITPPITEGILEGLTRDALIDLFQDEMKITPIERQIDRTELYVADEIFLCGTNMEITPVVSVDNYPIGDGNRGEITKKIQEIYFNIVRGENSKYKHWLTPVYNGKK